MTTAEEVIGAVVEDVEEVFCEGCPELQRFRGARDSIGIQEEPDSFSCPYEHPENLGCVKHGIYITLMTGAEMMAEAMDDAREE